MTYLLLGQDLHETAEQAKHFFSTTYGASGFKCEEAVDPNLPLRPTWQAKLKTGYKLCVNVQPSPFTPSLYEFVVRCAQKNLPVKLWVATTVGRAKESFSSEVRQAREAGIGVVEFNQDVGFHEWHRAVPTSLFALKKTDLSTVPKPRREVVKDAEATFLEGAPDQGCQSICQQLELVTRQFAERTYGNGWWRTPSGASPLNADFFNIGAWSNVLEQLEQRIDLPGVRTKSPEFRKNLIVRARGFTDWRNAVSHKPKTLLQLQTRDQKLRTMFEATRDLVIEWYCVAKPLKLLG